MLRISSFDFDIEQSFFSSLNGFRTTLGNLYMDRVFTKKRPNSPVIITEDDQQPYVTLEESREKEKEEQLARDQQRLDDLRQAEYEKERENQERHRIRQREIKRDEARARANAMFEESVNIQETAIDNERFRIQHLEDERREIEWNEVNENLNTIQRDRDLLVEEAVERNLEWDYVAEEPDTVDVRDVVDGVEDLPTEDLTDVKELNKIVRKKVVRDIDTNFGVDFTSDFLHPPYKRGAKKALHSLHTRKYRKYDAGDASSISSVSEDEKEKRDERRDYEYKFSDIDSEEESVSAWALKNRKPIRSIPRKVKSISKVSSAKLSDLTPLKKKRRKRAFAPSKLPFKPIQVLPSRASFVKDNVPDDRRFDSDISSEDEVELISEEEDNSPQLKKLKAQMHNYKEAFESEEDEVESLPPMSDEED